MSPTRILIVDDEKYNLLCLKTHFQREGYEVVTAQSGTAALEVLTREHFDMLLLDINMPDMSGIEITRKLKASPQYAHLPIILVTANSDLHNKIEGLQAGAIDYITKPYAFEEMLQRIKTHLALIERERHKVLQEMAGATAHELAQPLSRAIGNLQLILAHPKKAGEGQIVVEVAELEEIHRSLRQASEILHKIQKVKKYKTMPYVGDSQIIDLEKASK
ncbi:MAG: response regulator [Deltaproteobacteria bacterium]|nr:MAG: response regulator [Deltaproteobacteria bacterium]